MALIAAALLIGCGGKIPEAIHQPLLVTPAEARAVMIVDFINSRGLRNFDQIERFLKNNDSAYQVSIEAQQASPLPFDYEEFVGHWHLDPVRDIDQLIFGVYDSGWVAVMVGKFDVAHLTEMARTERSVTATSQRTPEKGDPYPLITEATRRNPSAIQTILLGLRALPFRTGEYQALFEELESSLANTGEIHQAFPTLNIWVLSNQQELLGQALDLWDGTSKGHLLTDPAFSELHRSRPQSARLVWIGLPSSAGVPPPLRTLQAELDVRDYITANLILGYDTSTTVENSYVAVDRRIQSIAALLAGLPQYVQQNRVGGLDATTAALDRAGLVPIFARLGLGMKAEKLSQSRVIQIQAPLHLTDFKALFSAAVRELITAQETPPAPAQSTEP